MLVVILGAGASFACMPDETRTPPLTRDLFGPRFVELLAPYQEAAALVDILRDEIAEGGDVEEILDRYQQEGLAGDDTTLMQLAAVTWYIRDVVDVAARATEALTSGVTRYASLLDHLRRWQQRSKERVAYITFNYDDILDNAWAALFRQDITSPQSLVAGLPPVPQVYHPHGSVNWWTPIMNYQDQLPHWTFPRQVVRKVGHLTLGQLQFSLAAQPGRVTNISGTPCLPAVALPLRSKAEFVCPDIHVSGIANALSEATRVLIIGWRAHEQHFLKLWAASKTEHLDRVLVVGVSESGCSEANLNLHRTGITASNIQLLTSGFQSLLKSPELQQLLS